MKLLAFAAMCLTTSWSCSAFVLPMATTDSVASQYHSRRASLISQEASLAIGGILRLSAEERKVDLYLKKLKRTEFEIGLMQPETFAPSMHFFRAKPLIAASPLFRLLRRMPKGALLHGHNSAMVSTEWIVQNLTYHPAMLTCNLMNGQKVFSFLRLEHHNCVGDYVRVVDEREQAGNADQYDSYLMTHLTMIVDHPNVIYPDSNAAWRRFSDLFRAVDGALNFQPTFNIVNTKLLQDLHDDRIMYAEIRTSFSGMKYEDGRNASKREVVLMWRHVIDDFRASHPQFLGVKFIFATSRNSEQLDNLITIYRDLRREFPDLIVGFDLVSQEDIGTPLINFLDTIQKNRDIDFFFHAGETDFNGFAADRNLFDAILFNTTRIGHGYSLYKHPLLMDLIKRRRICLEVCPISNQVLGLVQDLRNHPGSIYSSVDVPMVVSSDDPAFWGATGLSYDFYYALMSFTSVDTGLAYAKQLVINSLEFSRLTADERRLAETMFERQWGAFIDLTINTERLT